MPNNVNKYSKIDDHHNAPPVTGCLFRPWRLRLVIALGENEDQQLWCQSFIQIQLSKRDPNWDPIEPLWASYRESVKKQALGSKGVWGSYF